VNKILLDTNAYSNLLRGNRQVVDLLAAAETIYLSIFVIGELHAGFKGGNQDEENRKRLRAFLDKPGVQIVHTTLDTAELFADIKDQLRRASTPLPINDIWIAAHARECGAQIITADRHFEKIAGISVHLLAW
jgi:tRNA(fMet)-specific endonuclease VapC